MGLLPQLIIFPLVLFISSSFWLSGAIDCGGKNIATTIIVDQLGKGAFKTIQAAIDSIKSNNDQWVKIHINAGTYTEKVSIPLDKPCVILEGAGSKTTIIKYDDHQIANGKEVTTNTFDAQKYGIWLPTFSSSPPNVIVLGIAFKNSYNLGESSRIVPALAAAIFGDKCVFYKCSFFGFQDTLLDATGRHYYKSCYIQGEVDFIFGYGQSYFQDCVINATQGVSPPGYVTAQGRDSENDPSGFVFKGGFIIGSGQVNLGRAYGPYSRVIFYGTYFSSVVSPQGWNSWRYPGQESKFTYAEVDCIGPGANTSHRLWEKNLTASQLEEFSLSFFINRGGWLSNLPVSIL